MLVDEGTQATYVQEKKHREMKMVQDGMQTWQRQQEHARLKRIQDQTQSREMMERYWPWGQHTKETRPRGLRNLRLDGLFPHKDFEKAKRSVCGLEMGRPGGGAPNVNAAGRRSIRTKEDPMLRFQWGKDMRQTVDNTLRYRMNKEEKEAYRRELDKLVEEKIKQREKEKLENLCKEREILLMTPPWGRPGPGGSQWRHPRSIGMHFFKSLGYTNGAKKEAANKKKIYEEFKRTTLRPPNQITRKWCDEYYTKGANIKRNNQLSPLRDGKENGIELVPLMVQKRGNMKIPLGTTDVTRQGFGSNVSKWAMEGQTYLNELSSQMNVKRRELKETRLKEIEGARKHFTTWDAFWGRPGHGAPRSAIKKGCIEKMLYPKMIPIAAA